MTRRSGRSGPRRTRRVEPIGHWKGEAGKHSRGKAGLALDAEHCVTTASQHTVLTWDISQFCIVGTVKFNPILIWRWKIIRTVFRAQADYNASTARNSK